MNCSLCGYELRRSEQACNYTCRYDRKTGRWNTGKRVHTGCAQMHYWNHWDKSNPRSLARMGECAICSTPAPDPLCALCYAAGQSAGSSDYTPPALPLSAAAPAGGACSGAAASNTGTESNGH